MWASHMPAYAINWLSPDAAGESPMFQRQRGYFTKPVCALSWLHLSHQGQPQLPVPCRWHHLPFPPVNHIPRTHSNITPGSEQTQPKAEIPFITSAVRSPFRNTFFHVNPVPKRGGVGCADPETVLRMLLPPVYHRTPHLAHGQAVTALRQQAL